MGNKEQKEIIAKNLRYYIAKSGKPQNEIAKVCGIGATTLNNWVRGVSSPNFYNVQVLAEYFGIPKTALIDEHETDWDRIDWNPKTQEMYYLDDNSANLAQFAFEHPEYKVLFDASMKVKPEDIQFVLEMLNRMNND